MYLDHMCARQQREALGIDETLLRLSVGVENVEDLLQDLEQAFEKAEALELN